MNISSDEKNNFIALDPSMSIEDLVKLGVREIRLVEKISGKQPKTAATRKVAKKKK